MKSGSWPAVEAGKGDGWAWEEAGSPMWGVERGS